MQEPSTTFSSNGLTLSSGIPIFESSHSPSIATSKTHAPLLENNHPMLTRAKTNKSKPKEFMVLTESEQTSVKQV